jgi:hypothetical protein
MHRLTTLFPLVVLGVCLSTAPAGAQVPVPPGGSGTVIAVAPKDMATVQIGDKQQTVHLPNAQVGDKVDCKVAEGKWQCTISPK